MIAYLARAIGQIKSHVQILSGRVWGRARAIARARMTRLLVRSISMEHEIIEMKNIVKNELTVQHDTIICDPYLGRVYYKIKYGKV